MLIFYYNSMRAALRLTQASRASTTSAAASVAARRGFASSSARQLVGADAVGKDFTGEREKVADHAGKSFILCLGERKQG